VVSRAAYMMVCAFLFFSWGFLHFRLKLSARTNERMNEIDDDRRRRRLAHTLIPLVFSIQSNPPSMHHPPPPPSTVLGCFFVQPMHSSAVLKKMNINAYAYTREGCPFCLRFPVLSCPTRSATYNTCIHTSCLFFPFFRNGLFVLTTITYYYYYFCYCPFFFFLTVVFSYRTFNIVPPAITFFFSSVFSHSNLFMQPVFMIFLLSSLRTLSNIYHLPAPMFPRFKINCQSKSFFPPLLFSLFSLDSFFFLCVAFSLSVRILLYFVF